MIVGVPLGIKQDTIAVREQIGLSVLIGAIEKQAQTNYRNHKDRKCMKDRHSKSLCDHNDIKIDRQAQKNNKNTGAVEITHGSGVN